MVVPLNKYSPVEWDREYHLPQEEEFWEDGDGDLAEEEYNTKYKDILYQPYVPGTIAPHGSCLPKCAIDIEI